MESPSQIEPSPWRPRQAGCRSQPASRWPVTPGRGHARNGLIGLHLGAGVYRLADHARRQAVFLGAQDALAVPVADLDAEEHARDDDHEVDADGQFWSWRRRATASHTAMRRRYDLVPQKNYNGRNCVPKRMGHDTRRQLAAPNIKQCDS